MREIKGREYTFLLIRPDYPTYVIVELNAPTTISPGPGHDFTIKVIKRRKSGFVCNTQQTG
jgi:hypothetical protein